MKRRLWLFTSAVAVLAVLVAAVPLLVVAADRDHFMLALGLPLLAAAIAAAVALSGAVARRAARPVEELAEAAEAASAPVTQYLPRSAAGTA